jgi:ABC-2 type transport system permease protein
MRRIWELYVGHFRVTMARYMAYRVELVIWLLSMVLQPVVFLSVWRNAANRMGGTLNGFSEDEIATYFILVMLINHLTMAWVMFEWEGRVQKGELSYLLLRPHHVVHRDLGENITFKTATFPVMLLTACGLVLSFFPKFHIPAWSALAFVPGIIFAYVLRFSVDWITALGAFYTTRVDAINVLHFFVLLLFSGQMAPLPLMPPQLQTIATFLPYRWVVDFPARLLMGRLSSEEVVAGLLAQAFWIAAVALIGRTVWRHGLRRYTAVGI